MKKIALVCDSSADITVEQEKQLNVHVVRLPIFVDDQEYKECIEISSEKLKVFLDEGKIVKTSQPSPGAFIEFFDVLLKEYDEILYIPVSHTLSGTYATAKSLSENEYKGKVTVVKSRFAAAGIHDLLKDVHVLLSKGVSPQEIANRLENETEIAVYLAPYDLQTLKRGGRISGPIAALAGLLKIQVVLQLNNEGEIVKCAQTRTLNKAHELLVNTALVKNPQDYHWNVLHSSDVESAEKVKSMLAQHISEPIDVREILAIVRAHTGNKTIAISRISKLK